MEKEFKYFVHPSSYADEGCSIGAGTKIWHFCHIMSGAVIGENCNLGQNVFVAEGVKIGNTVKIQNNVSLYSGLTCDDHVFIGPSVVFTNIKNPRSHIPRKNAYIPTQILQGASIGANATIVCGTIIGRYALIGAGAVVVKDVPHYALIVGNPSRQIGWVSEYGHTLIFNEDNMAVCPESRQRYVLKNHQLIKLP